MASPDPQAELAQAAHNINNITQALAHAGHSIEASAKNLEAVSGRLNSIIELTTRIADEIDARLSQHNYESSANGVQ